MYPRLSCNLFRISSSHSSVPGRVSLNNLSSRAWAWVVSVVIFISMISLRVLARWCACYRSYRIDSLPRRLPPPWVSPRPLSGIQLGEIDWVRWRRPWAHASDQSGAVVIEQCLWCLFAGRGGSLCVFFFFCVVRPSSITLLKYVDSWSLVVKFSAGPFNSSPSSE